jgi:hypothetical protein
MWYQSWRTWFLATGKENPALLKARIESTREIPEEAVRDDLPYRLTGDSSDRA